MGVALATWTPVTGTAPNQRAGGGSVLSPADKINDESDDEQSAETDVHKLLRWYFRYQAPGLFMRARPCRIQFSGKSLLFLQILPLSANTPPFESCLTKSSANLRLKESWRRLPKTVAMPYESMLASLELMNFLSEPQSRLTLLIQPNADQGRVGFP